MEQCQRMDAKMITACTVGGNGGIVAKHEVCVRHTRADLWIESTRVFVGCERCFELAAIPADLCETGEQLRIVTAQCGAAEQTHHRVLSASDVGFELSIKMMREWKIRAKLK